MKIKVGTAYRMRNGGKTVIETSRVEGYYVSDELLHYSSDGVCAYEGKDPDAKISHSQNRRDYDLVAEWTEPGPVVTETVKRIKPGVYGAVEVLSDATDKTVKVAIWNGSPASPHLWFSAAELRAAAATLVEIADALDSGAA